MSRNAVAACATTGTALIALERAPWKQSPGDNWIEVEDVAAAGGRTSRTTRSRIPRHWPSASRAVRRKATARLHFAIRGCSRCSAAVARRHRHRFARPLRPRRRSRPDAVAGYRMDRRPQRGGHRRACQDRSRTSARPSLRHDRAPRFAPNDKARKASTTYWPFLVMTRASGSRSSGRRGVSPNCRR